MSRKTITWMVLIAFFIGAVGSIVIGRFGISYLSTIPGFSWLSKLSTNYPIVINRKEVVQLNEGANLVDLAKQSANITVGIYTKDSPDFLGNGIIISNDGLIFTSQKVIQNHSEVKVVLNDGRNFPGLVRATDPKTDLAVVTIQAQNLASAQLEDASNLEVGQRVLAAGRGNWPFVRNAVTGFLTDSVLDNSSLTKVFDSEIYSESFASDIKTNSEMIGAPVLNLSGHVVGMVLPDKFLLAEEMQTALNSYLAKGKITRTYFGSKYLSFSQSLAQLKGYPSAGALIISTEPAGPAALAGLVAGDLITQIDGQSLENSSFEQILNRHAASDIKLLVLRSSQQTELTVKLTEK